MRTEVGSIQLVTSLLVSVADITNQSKTFFFLAEPDMFLKSPLNTALKVATTTAHQLELAG